MSLWCACWYWSLGWCRNFVYFLLTRLAGSVCVCVMRVSCSCWCAQGGCSHGTRLFLAWRSEICAFKFCGHHDQSSWRHLVLLSWICFMYFAHIYSNVWCPFGGFIELSNIFGRGAHAQLHWHEMFHGFQLLISILVDMPTPLNPFLPWYASDNIVPIRLCWTVLGALFARI